MNYGRGFYKLEEEELIYAPNFVYSKDYELIKENRNSYTYPIDGWKWFESLDDACTEWSLDKSKYVEE